LLALGIAAFELRRRIGDGSNDDLGGVGNADATRPPRQRQQRQQAWWENSGRPEPQSSAAAVGRTASFAYDAEPVQQQMPRLKSIDGQSSRGGGGDGESLSVASSTAGQSAPDGLSASNCSRSTAVPGLVPAQQQSRLAPQLLPFDDSGAELALILRRTSRARAGARRQMQMSERPRGFRRGSLSPPHKPNLYPPLRSPATCPLIIAAMLIQCVSLVITAHWLVICLAGNQHEKGRPASERVAALAVAVGVVVVLPQEARLFVLLHDVSQQVGTQRRVNLPRLLPVRPRHVHVVVQRLRQEWACVGCVYLLMKRQEWPH